MALRDGSHGVKMLYDQRSTAAADCHGLNEGEVYLNNGLIIMSTLHESIPRNISDAT